MAICVKRTYTQVTVKDQTHLAFPDTVHGGLEPGSLDHLDKTRFIKWGVNMTDPIESGVIPRCCHALLLPSSYRHTIGIMKPSYVTLYIHHTNLGYAPKKYSFYVWAGSKKEIPIALPEDIKPQSGWFQSDSFPGYTVQLVKRIDVKPKLVQSSIAPESKPVQLTVPTILAASETVQPEHPSTAEIAAAIDIHEKAYYAAKYAVINDKIQSIEWVTRNIAAGTVVDSTSAAKKMAYLKAKRDLVETMM